MKTRTALLSLFFLAGNFHGAFAGPFDAGADDASGLVWKGLLDFRGVRTSKDRSALYDVGGLSNPGRNKLRYGGKDIDANNTGDRAATQFAVPQAALVLEAPAVPATRLHLQANFDADFEAGNGSVGLIEIYTESEWRKGPQAFKLKLGGFIPPVSWEHPETGWSTRYTLTPSAIGTWVGEDLRAFGAEGAWQTPLGRDGSARLTGAVFSGGDQSGWVLLERGWGLHDFLPDLNLTATLPNNDVYRPFKELDGRLGYYGRVDFSFSKDSLRIGGGHWDNNGDKKVRTLGSHLDVYHPQFQDIGARVQAGRLTVLAQGLVGSVESLSFAERDIQAFFVLAAYDFGRLLAAARVDKYKVDDLEDGTALTADLTWNLGLRQAVTAEYVGADTDPEGTSSLKSEKDTLISLNYRVRF